MGTLFHTNIQWRSQAKNIFGGQNFLFRASNSIFVWDTTSQAQKD